jgi:hypothetical protein
MRASLRLHPERRPSAFCWAAVEGSLFPPTPQTHPNHRRRARNPNFRAQLYAYPSPKYLFCYANQPQPDLPPLALGKFQPRLLRLFLPLERLRQRRQFPPDVFKQKPPFHDFSHPRFISQHHPFALTLPRTTDAACAAAVNRARFPRARTARGNKGVSGEISAELDKRRCNANWGDAPGYPPSQHPPARDFLPATSYGHPLPATNALTPICFFSTPG